MVVANDWEGRWCVFCIQINIIDHLNLPYQLWNQAPNGEDEWQGEGLVASQFVEWQPPKGDLHDRKAHLVNFELQVPMLVVQLMLIQMHQFPFYAYRNHCIRFYFYALHSNLW